MVLSDGIIRECTVRLMLSRMRLLSSSGFFGLLLMHMKFSIDEAAETLSTDGSMIIFPLDFLVRLSDEELDFVMLHEVMHIALDHISRRPREEAERFDLACDIVVNSTLLKERYPSGLPHLPTLGEIPHIAPNGQPGSGYSAEEVFYMLPKATRGKQGKGDSGKCGDGNGGDESAGDGEDKRGGDTGSKPRNAGASFDDHSEWNTASGSEQRDIWRSRMLNAAKSVSVRDPGNKRGLVPAFMKRMLEELKNPQIDWRTLLNNFIQEEVCDYSFSPPDRRFDDSPFLLPDFSEKDDTVKNILFMIDTSGSMSDEMITEAYSQVKGAVDQFGGRLSGWLGFFDAVVVEPVPFVDEDEFSAIRPVGGGGTSFDIIFQYVHEKMQRNPPESIIILTDGYAPFPDREAATDIPVLWIINNEYINPPWGITARIK